MPCLNLMALRKPCTQMWLIATHAMRGNYHAISLSNNENFSGFQVQDTHNASYFIRMLWRGVPFPSAKLVIFLR